MSTMLVTLTAADADNDLSTIQVYVDRDDGATVAELMTLYVEPLWDAVRPLITGVLVDAQIAVNADISTFTNNSPSALSDVQEKARFVFLTAPPRHPFSVSLPTADETIFGLSGAGALVDVTNSDVLAFTVLMTEDIGSGGINAVTSHGEDLSVFDIGLQNFRER